VYVPAGTLYTLTGLILKSGVRLIGAGKDVSFIKAPSSGSVHALRTVKIGTSKTLYSNISLENLTVSTQNIGAGALIYNTNGVRIKNVKFLMTGSGTANQSFVAQYCRNVYVGQIECTGGTGNAISINACDYFVVEANTVLDSVDDGIDIDHDFLEASPSINSTHGSVFGNIIRNVTNGNAIRVENSDYVSVFGNDISGVSSLGGAGIIVNASSGQTASHIAVGKNVITNCVTYGINVNDNSGTVSVVSLAQNIISNCGQSLAPATSGGIALNSNNVSVTSNYIDNCGKAGGDGGGILIYQTNGHQIAENTVENCVDGIRLWNGSGSVTYTDVNLEFNKLKNNTHDYVDAYSQPGVHIAVLDRTIPAIWASERYRRQPGSTFQGQSQLPHSPVRGRV
jgi:Pectate lyase superfamily protein/Right handed beta helix region